jgi:hypothetical protein
MIRLADGVLVPFRRIWRTILVGICLYLPAPFFAVGVVAVSHPLRGGGQVYCPYEQSRYLGTFSFVRRWSAFSLTAVSGRRSPRVRKDL